MACLGLANDAAFRQYLNLRQNAEQPDGEFLEGMFRDCVAFYSQWFEDIAVRHSANLVAQAIAGADRGSAHAG